MSWAKVVIDIFRGCLELWKWSWPAAEVYVKERKRRELEVHGRCDGVGDSERVPSVGPGGGVEAGATTDGGDSKGRGAGMVERTYE